MTNPVSPRTPMEWALLLELQILLETVRDAPDGREVDALNPLLLLSDQSAIPSPFPPPHVVAGMALERFSIDRDEVEQGSIAARLYEELKSWQQRLHRDGRELVCSQLIERVAPDHLFHRLDGSFITADLETRYWGMWYPGLENNDLTLETVRAALPGLPPTAIPDEIRELENPSSANALPGAVSLPWHDVVHILLGRGLLDQDEAFVIGFTMGNASRYRDVDGEVMRHALAKIYPEPFRIQGPKLQAFRLGTETGREMGVRDIADREQDIDAGMTLGALRSQFQIDSQVLRNVYAQERALIPHSLESGRLPR